MIKEICNNCDNAVEFSEGLITCKITKAINGKSVHCENLGKAHFKPKLRCDCGGKLEHDMLCFWVCAECSQTTLIL